MQIFVNSEVLDVLRGVAEIAEKHGVHQGMLGILRESDANQFVYCGSVK